MEINPDRDSSIVLVAVALGGLVALLVRAGLKGEPPLRVSGSVARWILGDALLAAFGVWAVLYLFTLPSGTAHWVAVIAIFAVVASGTIRHIASKRGSDTHSEDGARETTLS